VTCPLYADLFLFSPSSPQGVPAIDQPHILDQLKGTLIHVRPLPATMTTLQPQASLAEAATPQLQPTTTAVSGTDGPNTLIRFPASCTSSSHLDIPSFPESTRSSVQGCPCCGGTQVHLAAPHYTYDTFPRWGPPLAAASLEDEAADLLGPWASVPISDDYTFGIEIEFAFHGVCLQHVPLPFCLLQDQPQSLACAPHLHCYCLPAVRMKFWHCVRKRQCVRKRLLIC
jgi:hypothetical protein